MFGKEAITVARLDACGSAIAATGMQAFTRRDNRQVRRHHAGFAQLMLFYAVTPAFMAATAKVFSRHAGDRTANAWIGQCKMRVGEIWLTSTHGKRSNETAVSIEIVDHGDVHHVYVIKAAPIPGIKGIMRTDGEPSDRAEAGMMPEAHKEDECRRP